ncbi:class E sortase [Streptomyces qinzhouensis]|uniref:Class E sortase n=1 Tax=Streptomyces qinzhouensis TaxID=2599401 RepID=A0A5B8JHE2_9ACTN|nr:class E sortase [Streptomyces qinzhouensis]QDY80926.1 class E sortase [Streptomyces qinzhouensis]
MPVVVQGRGRRARVRAARVLWGVAEAAVTFGVVVLLLVVHQLWWTNRQARAGAERAVHSLERQWEEGKGEREGREEEKGQEERDEGEGGDSGVGEGRGRSSGVGREPVPLRSDTAYAIIRIPRLGVTAPVAEGVAKQGVLDKGYVGHYPGTARPGRPGNVALAGHRNTHGEPFRYINRLRRGDDIRIETRDTVYVYEVDRQLARTSPRDIGVIRPVPRSLTVPGAGYREPGRYLTLTTCTPEFSSAYRLIVWGKLTATLPRRP